MDLAKFVDYLSRGGLVEILTFGMGGAPYPPVWLNLDRQGKVIHTFSAETGGIGGTNVPGETLRNGKIIESRSRVVIDFLQSFGLDARQAEQIVFAIGIEGGKPGPPHSMERTRWPDKAN